MKNTTLPLLFGILAATAPWAEAIHICNNAGPCYRKKVVIYNEIRCGDYYFTSFYCEHYLENGECLDLQDGPESGGQCWHYYYVQSEQWISVVYASFPNPLITLHYSVSPTVQEPNVVVTIPSGINMSLVSFESSNTGRFLVAEVGSDTASRTKTLWFGATSSTPDASPGGDAYVRIIYNGTNVCAGPSVVCERPKSRTHSVSASSWHNTASIVPHPTSGANTTQLTTDVGRTATITIKNQFGNVLSAAYNGSGVVEEQFVNQSGHADIQWVNSKKPITEPNSVLTNGVKLDRVEHEIILIMPSGNVMTAAQRSAWVAGSQQVVYPGLGTGYNVFQIFGENRTKSATMRLWVRNVEVNSVVRTFSVQATHQPTCTLSN